VSSTFETGIGLYSNLVLASEMAGETVAGLGTYDWITNDLVVPRMSLSQPLIELNSVLHKANRLDRDYVDVVHSVTV
jgi:O-succinylbenzoate synthase